MITSSHISKERDNLLNGKKREDYHQQQHEILENEYILNPITSPFKVFSNNNKNLYGTGNSICIGSNFYIISAGQQVFIPNNRQLNNSGSGIGGSGGTGGNNNDNYNNLDKEMLISVGSLGENIKVLKLFVIESILISVSYSIHNLPFITNFISEIGRVRIKQIDNSSLLFKDIYKEGNVIRKNGVASGFTQGVIIRNLSHLFLANPEFSKNGDCGSLVVNDDCCVIGVLLSSNQNHTIIAKLELFNFLFK